MPNERWIFDTRSGRYRDEASGRFIPAQRIQEMRDALLTSSDARIRALADQLADGNLNVGHWEREMRDAIKILYGVQYVFGRGGLNAMQPEDWTRLGQLVKQQHQFLGSFATDVAAGKLSGPKLRVRADLYVGSSVQAHEAGKSAAWELELPAQPADGSSECLANDRCAWHLRRRADGKVEATWVAGLDARTCKTCRKRAKDWNPLLLTPGEPAPTVQPASTKLRTPSRQQFAGVT